MVGCGYTGLSTALHLAEAGAKVVALEAVEIGFGGAGRNVGLVNAGMWLAPDEIVARLGAGLWRAAARPARRRPGGSLRAWSRSTASTANSCATARCIARSGGPALAKIEERARQWGARGAPVEAFSAAAETARRIGVDIYAGSLLDLRAGTIQPLAYARGLARAAIAAGAAIHTRSPVRSAERTGKVWRLATGGGTVAADWVVVATDAYAQGAPWPQGKREQIRVPYFNFATRPLAPELRPRSCPAARAAGTRGSIMNSFRFDRAGRLLFGSIGALRLAGLEVHRAWARARSRRPFRRSARSSSRRNGTG